MKLSTCNGDGAGRNENRQTVDDRIASSAAGAIDDLFLEQQGRVADGTYKKVQGLLGQVHKFHFRTGKCVLTQDGRHFVGSTASRREGALS